jgi:hypothetical protein
MSVHCVARGLRSQLRSAYSLNTAKLYARAPGNKSWTRSYGFSAGLSDWKAGEGVSASGLVPIVIEQTVGTTVRSVCGLF